MITTLTVHRQKAATVVSANCINSSLLLTINDNENVEILILKLVRAQNTDFAETG